MPLIDGHVHFPALTIANRFCLILPDSAEDVASCPVLWLLADWGEGCDIWLRSTDIEHIAQGLGLVVVMVEGQHSYYADMKHGPAWETYLTQALPAYLADQFGISRKANRQNWFAFGMGGFFVLRQGLRTDCHAAGAACLNAALFHAPTEEEAAWLTCCYSAEELATGCPNVDPFTLAKDSGAVSSTILLADQPHQPTYPAMVQLRDAMKTAGIPIIWQEGICTDVYELREACLQAFIQRCVQA